MAHDDMLDVFKLFLKDHADYSFRDPWMPDESPLAEFFWNQVRIRLEVDGGQLILGEVTLPLPAWAARFQLYMADKWPYRSVTGKDCLELLDRVLAECDDQNDQADNALDIELGEGD